MEEIQTPVCLEFQVRFEGRAAYDKALVALKVSNSPDGFVLSVADLTPRGAFDAEFIIGLVLSFPIGIAGNLVAAWLLKHLEEEKSSTIIVFVDRSISLARPDAQEVIEGAVKHSIEQATGSQDRVDKPSDE